MLFYSGAKNAHISGLIFRMLHHHARWAVDCVYESNLCSQIVLWRSFRIFVRVFPLDMLDKHLRQSGREVQKCAYPHRNFPKAALPRWCYPCMLIHARFVLSISRLACFSIVVCVFPLVPGNDTKSFILDVACENVHISGVFFRMQHYCDRVSRRYIYSSNLCSQFVLLLFVSNRRLGFFRSCRNRRQIVSSGGDVKKCV